MKELIEAIVFEESTVMVANPRLDDEPWLDDIGNAPERIIAAFSEALLSEPVVEAAVKSVRAWHGDMMPVAKAPNGNDYGPLDDDDWGILADAILTAALASMGVETRHWR